MRACTNVLTHLTSLYDNILIQGDLNYDLLKPNVSQPLNDIMDLHDMNNLINKPTYTGIHGDSLIDVSLTNIPYRFLNSDSMDIGVSDGHNLIYSITKLTKPKPEARTITYRSFKTYNKDSTPS